MIWHFSTLLFKSGVLVLCKIYPSSILLSCFIPCAFFLYVFTVIEVVKVPAILLPLQAGPLVVPHCSAALFCSGWHRHPGRAPGSQGHSPEEWGHLPQLLPLHVLQRQGSALRGKPRQLMWYIKSPSNMAHVLYVYHGCGKAHRVGWAGT